MGTYTYNAKTVDGYNVLNSSTKTVTLTEDSPNASITFEYDIVYLTLDVSKQNEVPYISTYYIKPIVEPEEDVFINYYITDYYHKEYLEEDYSENFTVTVRIEGQTDKVFRNIKAGDHQVSLGSFSNLGEQNFSILCTDAYGRNSHELFNFFLVQDDIEIKEYIMTKDDLVTYNIKNDDNYEQKIYVKVNKLTDTTTGTKIEEIANATTVPSKKYICFIGTTEVDNNGNPIMQSTAARFWLNTIVKYADDYDKDAVLQESTNTLIGLQQFLNDKKAEGYNKVILLPGTYRVDHQDTIYVPTNFTVDMNGSTFKQNQFTGDKSLIISLDSTFDSHVINGTIEGDYFSHDYTNSANNSEWPMGISIAGECKYSSYENISVKNITGYGAGNGISQKSGFSYFAKALGNIFTLGDINLTTGETISSTNRQTTTFIDISSYSKYKYIAINRYLGYQGMLGGSWNLILHFYNNSKKYICSISSYQYRRTKIPSNACFMKVTILSATSSTDFWMVYFKVPCHCNFTNVSFYNCRCVGLAQAAMNDMLVDSCSWTLNGQSGAFCAYDAEDGWDQMQDVTFRKLNFHDNPNNDFLTCAGHNFIIENMIDGKVYFWERTNSYVVRNCNNLDSASLGHTSRKRSGYTRFYNNTINGNITIGAAEENDDWPLTVKDCSINGRAENIIDTGLYLRCNIGKSNNKDNNWNTALGNGNFKDCTISNKSGENMGGTYENCTFENINGNIHGTFKISNSTINNWNTYAGGYEPSYTFANCKLNNFEIIFGYWHQGATTLFDNCTINNEDFLLKLPHYSMKKPISIINSSFTSNGKEGMVVFYDDRTGGSAGELVEQDILTIENNKISLNNSQYVVSGISKDTINNINIAFRNNELLSEKLQLYDDECKESENIKIIEK